VPEEEEEEEDEDVVFLNDPGGVDPSFFSRSFSYVKAKCVENTRGGKFSWIVLFYQTVGYFLVSKVAFAEHVLSGSNRISFSKTSKQAVKARCDAELNHGFIARLFVHLSSSSPNHLSQGILPSPSSSHAALCDYG
jgi:hypothetical protein